MPASFARETLVRLRYPSSVDHGASVVDWTATPAESPIPGCWLEPITSTEDNVHRAGALSGYTVSTPYGIDLTGDDHIRYEGAEYEVDGDVMRVKSPTGALNHTMFAIKRWRG